MKPPYDITPTTLKLISEISEKLGVVQAGFMDKPTPQLRKQNKIQTIHHSLKMEGNSLSENQITEIVENKRVIGPSKDIREVVNAIEIYDNLKAFSPSSEKSFLKAHGMLMKGLVSDAGNFRKQGVGIVKGDIVEHLAPHYQKAPYLMKDLFNYLKNPEELTLIKSCVFHYEMEFIHPFVDGNGRMGRLWQTLILLQDYEVFEFLPFETLISQSQKDYYRVLAECDKSGKSTLFIEYMLDIINQSLEDLLNQNRRTLTQSNRLDYFLSKYTGEFSRKDYMMVFKNISSATASRDLKAGIQNGLLRSTGSGNRTVYKGTR
ncbi:MAG: Fic family protein [Schleiferiaceae bacterium]